MSRRSRGPAPPPSGLNDDTIRVRRRRPALRAGWPIAIAALLAGTAILVYHLTRPARVPIDTETEAMIDARRPCQINVSRFASDPAIVVVDFPSLLAQGLALNRVAALVEKAATPRDRVLDDAALAAAITQCGATVESYYYGHDYRAADLARFFALAAQDGVVLNPQELWVERLARQLGWVAPGAVGALISLPAVAAPVTDEMRAVILHHELAHGAFYTIPAYQHYAETFWASLTPADRAAFTSFLGREGYDMRDTELMLNETQAYLIFTRDRKFFNAQAVGMTEPEIATLRAGYIPGIPVAWLRPMADAALPVAHAPQGCG